MSEFLDFKEISQRIPFADVLDYLNISYTSKGKELRGEGFIIDTEKNLYFNPKGDDKGSVINFLHAHKGGILRDCALELKKQLSISTSVIVDRNRSWPEKWRSKSLTTTTTTGDISDSRTISGFIRKVSNGTRYTTCTGRKGKR